MPLIFDRVCSQVLLDHQRNLEDDGVVKLPQVQAGELFDLLQAVDQGVSVNEQLAGGFRNVQVVFKEFLDGEQRLVVEAVDRALLKDLLEEHLAQGGRQLVDQMQSQCSYTVKKQKTKI